MFSCVVLVKFRDVLLTNQSILNELSFFLTTINLYAEILSKMSMQGMEDLVGDGTSMIGTSYSDLSGGTAADIADLTSTSGRTVRILR